MSLIGRSAPLYIYAPRDFSSILNFFLAHFGEGVKFTIEHKVLDCSAPEMIFESKSTEVYAFPLNHRISTFGFLFKEKEPKMNIFKDKVDGLTFGEMVRLKSGEDVIRDNGQILAFKDYTYIPYKSRSAAYCSDTAPFEALPQWIKGVDLLYHEATFASDRAEMAKATNHSTALQAATVAKLSGAGQLIIGHYSSRYPDLTVLLEEARTIFPNTFLAKEGMKFEVSLQQYNE